MNKMKITKIDLDIINRTVAVQQSILTIIIKEFSYKTKIKLILEYNF